MESFINRFATLIKFRQFIDGNRMQFSRVMGKRESPRIHPGCGTCRFRSREESMLNLLFEPFPMSLRGVGAEGFEPPTLCL